MKQLWRDLWGLNGLDRVPLAWATVLGAAALIVVLAWGLWAVPDMFNEYN